MIIVTEAMYSDATDDLMSTTLKRASESSVALPGVAAATKRRSGARNWRIGAIWGARAGGQTGSGGDISRCALARRQGISPTVAHGQEDPSNLGGTFRHGSRRPHDEIQRVGLL